MKAATELFHDIYNAGAISIHAAREGGDLMRLSNDFGQVISIHAAREGGDQIIDEYNFPQLDFNPRRP